MDHFRSITDGFRMKTDAYPSIAVVNGWKTVHFVSIHDDFATIRVWNPAKAVVNRVQMDGFRAKTVLYRPIKDAPATIKDGNRV